MRRPDTGRTTPAWGCRFPSLVEGGFVMHRIGTLSALVLSAVLSTLAGCAAPSGPEADPASSESALGGSSVPLPSAQQYARFHAHGYSAPPFPDLGKGRHPV